ncbi:diphthine--ammonia ligase-like [Zingiber officinale]|uniref:diphthine--ammonia ligase-like n=1 Tax=Zingiber officinale TaxID=94328 RepID=UPI001C4B6667|nr:diphthine--ammonia ligase-like [Zingiber officinale]
MKVVALVSGGKDSCFAMMRCVDYGHEVVALANLLPLDDSVDELDSYMYQTVGHQILVSYAECMGLPLFRRRIHGSMRHQHLNYKTTSGDEVEDLFILLSEIKKKIPSITAVSSGAIASDYQRLRVESVCCRLGLVSLAYLWKQDQTFLLEEMIRRDIIAITVKVAAMGLDPAKHLGKELAKLTPHLLQVKELYGINVCGEGGEYETLTLDCPLFSNARIFLDKFEVILHSPDHIAPVGILHPLTFHLQHKDELSSSNTSIASLTKAGYVCEVQGESKSDDTVESLSTSLQYDIPANKNLRLSISRSNKDMLSISCWVQNHSNTSEGLQEDLTAVLFKIESRLKDDGFDWLNVLYIHLYISDMKNFALANDVYVKFITEKKCFLGVPSRSTIELPLLQVGLGKAFVEVLLASDHDKKVLHVQSISCWAPSCIGPYSQATLHREVLYMAGQLGLDPPTMGLRSGGPAIETEQALMNSEAVANSFNASLTSSSIFLVVYCAASLTFSERTLIQHKMESFLENHNSQHSKRMHNPVFLYILAPALPKGAVVEVKPILHVPTNIDDEAGNSSLQPTGKTATCDFHFVECCSSCYQIYSVSGKICTALVSVTKDLAAKICFTDKSELSPLSQMRIIIKFCIFSINKILVDHCFFWDNLMYLKFYYTTSNSLTAETLNLVFSEVFAEFAEANKSLKMDHDQTFSLIPVLSSGRSASMEDIISCELFASKL